MLNIKNKIKDSICKMSLMVDENLHNYNKQYDDLLYIFDRYVNNGVLKSCNFDFEDFKKDVFNYLNTLSTNDKLIYRFANSVSKPTLYSIVYSFLTNQLLNIELSEVDRNKYIELFNSYQNENGYFYDKELESENYYNLNWWGGQHIALHLITAFSYLNTKPKYEFNYIKKYYDKDTLIKYLDNLEFNDIVDTDSDNAIMNLGTIFQYQRDFFSDDKAIEPLNILFDELEKKINKGTGSWGFGKDDDPKYLSRAQQFAYHLYPLWLYDKRDIRYINEIIDLTLKNQTVLGGFGAVLNTSACEDIDSIDLLIKLNKLTDYKKDEINNTIKKAFPWVFANQNNDGGFVFNRNEYFYFGHNLNSSVSNESNVFATWFRTLSIAYMANYLNLKNDFNIGYCPGYQF